MHWYYHTVRPLFYRPQLEQPAPVRGLEGIEGVFTIFAMLFIV